MIHILLYKAGCFFITQPKSNACILEHKKSAPTTVRLTLTIFFVLFLLFYNLGIGSVSFN